jgi:hypothetical protein
MWLEHINSVESLTSIFGNTKIVNSANLRRVSFENSSTTLSFDLASWPESPPRKWVEKDANTVLCEVVLVGCTETELKHWAPDNVGEFRLKSLGDGCLSLKFVTKSGVYLNCMCEAAVITKVSAYKNA